MRISFKNTTNTAVKIFTLLLLFSIAALSQEEEYLEDEISRVHFVEANFSSFVPLEAFAEKIEKDVLIGFSLAYLVQLQKEKPSFIGVDIFYKSLGTHSKDYDALVGNAQVEISGRASSSAIGLSGIYRYYIPMKFWRLEPYLEGQFGGKWLYSLLSESGSFLDNEPYENTDLLESDFVLTYGGAFGLQLHINDIYYLNLKSAYHFAVSGEYQNKRTEDLQLIDFPQQAFETVQSTTSVLRIDVGFTFLF
ncbi:MAG: hypothetical protein P1U56_04510 [Saprospiraceae bacterium]|nr:hypothetical protein [Saprospiraceae bacterium]